MYVSMQLGHSSSICRYFAILLLFCFYYIFLCFAICSYFIYICRNCLYSLICFHALMFSCTLYYTFVCFATIYLHMFSFDQVTHPAFVHTLPFLYYYFCTIHLCDLLIFTYVCFHAARSLIPHLYILCHFYTISFVICISMICLYFAMICQYLLMYVFMRLGHSSPICTYFAISVLLHL